MGLHDSKTMRKGWSTNRRCLAETDNILCGGLLALWRGSRLGGFFL